MPHEKVTSVADVLNHRHRLGKILRFTRAVLRQINESPACRFPDSVKAQQDISTALVELDQDILPSDESRPSLTTARVLELEQLTEKQDREINELIEEVAKLNPFRVAVEELVALERSPLSVDRKDFEKALSKMRALIPLKVEGAHAVTP